MNNPTCAFCLTTIESPSGATVGMFFDKTNRAIEAYCLCSGCAQEFRKAKPEQQQSYASLIEKNLKVEGVSLDPNQKPFSNTEGE